MRQHHLSSLPSSFERDVFVHSERHGERGSLGGESPHSSPPPVHHGVVQRQHGRLKSPQSGDRVRMNPSPGGSRSAGPQVASDDRSLCNLPDSEVSRFTSLQPQIRGRQGRMPFSSLGTISKPTPFLRSPS